MKRIILPIICVVCLVAGFGIGWYAARARVDADASPVTVMPAPTGDGHAARARVDADASPVTIMPAPTGDGHVRSYSPIGLQNIAEQYLTEHHITIPRDGIAVTVQMDSKQPFATVYFLKSSIPIHAVEIGADGTAIRDYACQTFQVK
jgi:hypothetical protein